MPNSPSPEMDGAEARIAAVELELADFTSTVAHDVSACFRQINGFLGLLMRDLDGKLEPAQRDTADRIADAAAKGHGMMEEMLAYSRAQQAVLDIAACDATLLADEARLRLSGEIRRSGAQIEVAPLGRVRVDRALMSRAFAHVLDNALKFRRADFAPCVTVTLAPDDDRWAARIRDNGVGVAPDERESAFRMFHRLNPDAGHSGVGAGLSISRRILRRHGGDVRFIDCSDGACVELSLPGEARATATGS
jgi:signal transduction histidine kinase